MNAVVINVIFAIFWLVVGGLFLLQEPLLGRKAFILANGINPGWLAVVLGAFNLFRAWYNWSANRRRQQQREEDNALREQWDRHDSPPQSPDPNLKFTDEG